LARGRRFENGADVNGWDGLHEATPIIMALVRNNLPALRPLLEGGGDPNVRSREGEGPLRWAADEGNLEMAQLFLQYGAAKTIDEYGGFRALTALGMAVERLDVPMIELLLAAGADPEARDFDDMTGAAAPATARIVRPRATGRGAGAPGAASRSGSGWRRLKEGLEPHGTREVLGGSVLRWTRSVSRDGHVRVAPCYARSMSSNARSPMLANGPAPYITELFGRRLRPGHGRQ
jgi:hypothetical protein